MTIEIESTGYFWWCGVFVAVEGTEERESEKKQQHTNHINNENRMKRVIQK